MRNVMTLAQFRATGRDVGDKARALRTWVDTVAAVVSVAGFAAGFLILAMAGGER